MSIEGIDGSLNSYLGILVTGLGSLTGGFFLFKKVLRSDNIGAANIEGQIDLIDRLSKELINANTRADLAEKKATEAIKEVNGLLREMGELRARMGELTVEIRMLKERIPVSMSADIQEFILAKRISSNLIDSKE